MNSDIISAIFFSCFNKMPQKTERCTVGIANYVYIVKCDDIKYILRCSVDKNAYEETVYWLKNCPRSMYPCQRFCFADSTKNTAI